MSGYTNSNATIGLGTTFSVNTGTEAAPVYTLVGEIQSFTQSGKVNKFATTTNLESNCEEYLPVLPSGGTFSLDLNRLGSSDAGQTQLAALFTSKALSLFKIQLPKSPTQTTTGDSYVGWTGYIEEFSDLASVSPDKQQMLKVTIKVSGVLPTVTAGS